MSDLIDWTMVTLVVISTIAVLISAWKRKGWNTEEVKNWRK